MKKRIIAAEDLSDNLDYQKMINSRGFKRVAQLCKSNGYTLSELYYEKYGSAKRLYISIGTDSQYHADIYLSHRRNKPDEFHAQTTAYGALNSEEYIAFANAVRHTQALLSALDDMDWDSIDIPVFEIE